MDSARDVSPTPSTEGSAFPWILEHLLAYPGNYEIPLRTMYTLNSAPRAQPLPRQSPMPGTPALSESSSTDSSPVSPGFPPEQQQQLDVHVASNHFKSCLMKQISQLPSQPFSLPPSFVTSFVRRCFTEDLCLVDFTQALTALDYLKDLDNRRKRELRAALRRLDIDSKTFAVQGDEIGRKFPGVLAWVDGMKDKEKKVEALYTQIYVGLRRWTLINEMRLEPFNKANSIAMLNTLYPPTSSAPPTSQLTTTILAAQRNGFFRYIQAVERNGKEVLKNLEHQGERPNDQNGWAVVREMVDKYLRAANGVIEECAEITGRDIFNPESQEYRYRETRTDSGVSLVPEDRPTTTTSNYSNKSNCSANNNKPLPPSPARNLGPANSSSALPPPIRPPPTPPAKKGGSTLERVMREIKRIRTRNEVQEIARKEEKQKVKSLKKMKSASDIGKTKTHTKNSSGSSNIFTIDDLKREQLLKAAASQRDL